jgi:hypothetical protein
MHVHKKQLSKLDQGISEEEAKRMYDWIDVLEVGQIDDNDFCITFPANNFANDLGPREMASQERLLPDLEDIQRQVGACILPDVLLDLTLLKKNRVLYFDEIQKFWLTITMRVRCERNA